MAKQLAEIEGVSIVLRGHFNPAIVTHGWLLAQKLLSVDDYQETVPQLLTPEVSHFEGPWFQCHLTHDMLQVSTTDVVEAERVRDLVVGILRTLPHTPVGVMGINHDYHFETAGPASWHHVGDTFAPKDPWGDVLHLPGMLSLATLAMRPDDEVGRIRVTIEPSNRITPYGVYVGYNDHYSLVSGQAPVSRDQVLETLVGNPLEAEPSAAKTSYALNLLAERFHDSFKAAQAALSRVQLVARSAS